MPTQKPQKQQDQRANNFFFKQNPREIRGVDGEETSLKVDIIF